MESVRRDKYIKVYVVQEEKAVIEERASSAGLTCSNYLRSCGLKQLIASKPSTDAIAIRTGAGTLNNKLTLIKHLVVESQDQQVLDTVNDALALVNEIIVAASNFSK